MITNPEQLCMIEEKERENERERALTSDRSTKRMMTFFAPGYITPYDSLTKIESFETEQKPFYARIL